MSTFDENTGEKKHKQTSCAHWYFFSPPNHLHLPSDVFISDCENEIIFFMYIIFLQPMTASAMWNKHRNENFQAFVQVWEKVWCRHEMITLLVPPPLLLLLLPFKSLSLIFMLAFAHSYSDSDSDSYSCSLIFIHSLICSYNALVPGRACQQ